MQLRAAHKIPPVLLDVVRERFELFKNSKITNPNLIRRGINDCIKPLRGYCADAVVVSVKSQLLEEYFYSLNCCKENNSGIDL